MDRVGGVLAEVEVGQGVDHNLEEGGQGVRDLMGVGQTALGTKQEEGGGLLG